MMGVRELFLLIFCLWTTTGWSQTNLRDPHIGYVYPAGGRQGTTVLIRGGGQFLNGSKSVVVSGTGVQASVVGYVKAYGPLNREEFLELKETILKKLADPVSKEVNPSRARQERRIVAPPKTPVPGKARTRLKEKAQSPSKAKSRPKGKGGKAKTPVSTNTTRKTEAPTPTGATDKALSKTDSTSKTTVKKEHPLLRDLETMNRLELDYVAETFLIEGEPRGRKQMNPQIAETVLIEVVVEAGAAPGDRELRILTAAGLTNPLCFQVGVLPEVLSPTITVGQWAESPLGRSSAPGARKNSDVPKGGMAERSRANTPPTPPLDLPVLLNGQIQPGESDRFPVRARQGQQLVIHVQARHLIPYLADAVPGWFQATLSLYDAQGREVAFSDDNRFDPDPILFYTVPTDGEYQVEIRDALYRGRKDFVYRIAVGELPYITHLFPLGGQTGVATEATITGFNLPCTQVKLNTQPGTDYIRRLQVSQAGLLSNSPTYAVDTLSEVLEVEPNDSTKTAQAITTHGIVNGRIAQPGDKDVFRFEGHAGEQVVAEVWARRLGSPLDALLELTDNAGHVLVRNDDFKDRTAGWLTHHADSCLSATLPLDGEYRLILSDTQHHGGEEYGYRLRLTPPQPDFFLRVTPSSLNIPASRSVAFQVHAIRKQGFSGAIDLQLKNAPANFILSGARIPAGHDSVRLTLTATGEPLAQPIPLTLEGCARVGAQTVTRPAIPAEDMMQAFALRHLAPSQMLMVTSKGGAGRRIPIEAADGWLRIPAGGTAEVRFKTANIPALRDIQLELNAPPRGITLQGINMVSGSLTLTLKADEAEARIGYSDNLIVEAFSESQGVSRNAKSPGRQQRNALGVLPAIPFEIVARTP